MGRHRRLRTGNIAAPPRDRRCRRRSHHRHRCDRHRRRCDRRRRRASLRRSADWNDRDRSPSAPVGRCPFPGARRDSWRAAVEHAAPAASVGDYCPRHDWEPWRRRAAGRRQAAAAALPGAAASAAAVPPCPGPPPGPPRPPCPGPPPGPPRLPRPPPTAGVRLEVLRRALRQSFALLGAAAECVARLGVLPGAVPILLAARVVAVLDALTVRAVVLPIAVRNVGLVEVVVVVDVVVHVAVSAAPSSPVAVTPQRRADRHADAKREQRRRRDVAGRVVRNRRVRWIRPGAIDCGGVVGRDVDDLRIGRLDLDDRLRRRRWPSTVTFC